VRRRAWLAAAGAVALALVAPGEAGEPDRLERFRVLAVRHLTAAQLGDPRADDASRELWALIDEEIVDSLASGGVFASLGFLQERLDGFTAAWGGAALRVERVGALTVGAFQLGEGPALASVRVYGRVRGEPGLLAAFVREGRPSVHPVRPVAGAVQFLVAWEGPPTGRGTRPLRLDLIRQRGDEVVVVWSTARVYGEGLAVREWRLREDTLRLRYELRYPGWAPGCAGQTEQEDVWRLAPGAEGLVRVAERAVNAWHRAFHQTAARLYRALEAGDAGTLAALVPDARVRARLPAGLAPQSACDAVEPAGAATPVAVSTAATAGDGRPWTLRWRRADGRWRLVAAEPVLQ